MTQNTSMAVMQARGTDPRQGLDFFPTPPWAARAGGELIMRLETETAGGVPARSRDEPSGEEPRKDLEASAEEPGKNLSCWEPACGEGHMSHGLADYFSAPIYSSDIHDYGYGQVIDFLGPRLPDPGVDWIVTNPPFRAGEAFVRAAWPLARRGIAMLLRIAFLEGAARHQLLYGDCPLSVVAPFAERVPMVAGRWDPDASSATCYAWFIFLRGSSADASSRAQAGTTAPEGQRWPLVIPIPPGTKARLSRPSDRAFAAESKGALL